MNMENIKSKDNYSPDAVKNRLITIEKNLQQIMQLLGSETNNSLIVNKNSGLLGRLSLPPMEIAQNSYLNRTVINPTQIPLMQQNNNKNSLLLSRGQMVSELAVAIMRANQRNS